MRRPALFPFRRPPPAAWPAPAELAPAAVDAAGPPVHAPAAGRRRGTASTTAGRSWRTRPGRVGPAVRASCRALVVGVVPDVLPGLALSLVVGLVLGLPPAPAKAQTGTVDEATIVDARDAARRRDKPRLASLRSTFDAAQHPLLPWVATWELGARLRELAPAEAEAHLDRFAGSLSAERFAIDWGLELGRRRDFAGLSALAPRLAAPVEPPAELRCWLLLAQHLAQPSAARDLREAARNAWLAQREADEGCQMLATALVDARVFNADDVWAKARLAVEQQRPAAARAAAGLLGNAVARDAADALDNPARHLRRTAHAGQTRDELRLLALMRLAANEPADALAFMSVGDADLPAALAAPLWAYVGRQAAFKLQADAGSHYQRALTLKPRGSLGASDETLAWGVRAALRGLPPAARWPLVLQLVAQMSPAAQKDPAWLYWRAQALKGSARPGTAGEAARTEAQALLAGLAGPLGFYPLLAAEDLGQPPAWPTPAAPTSAAEREAAARHPGLQRAQLLLNAGLRDEARREWNHALRGMDDRGLLAAARLACERQDWQLCINTAERTRQEVDLALRYPTPFAAEIRVAAQAAGLEPAYVFGLIRQETRFMPQLRSSVGATGLMQVMPATGNLVARRLGLACCTPQQLADTATNLRLGTAYLKWVLDDLSGSQALAAAGYNAGPNRPRRWREGATLDAAAWAENVPFNETRDYVKRVLANAAVYAALPSGQPPQLRPRLGQHIGPAPAAAATPSGPRDDAPAEPRPAAATQP